MKKYLLSLFLVGASGIVISVLNGDANALSNGGGAPDAGGCSCHNITNANDINSTVEIKTLGDTAVTTYQNGQTYKVIVSITKPSKTKYGFALSASAGTLAVRPGSAATQKISNYITHTGSGNTFPTGTAQWETRWTAPASGTTAVLFTALFNASNANNSESGDQIFSKTATLNFGFPTGLSSTEVDALHIYPTLVNDKVNVYFNQQVAGNVKISLIDLQGKTAETLLNETVESGAFSRQINMNNNHPAGIYFVRIEAGVSVSVKKIVIQ